MKYTGNIITVITHLMVTDVSEVVIQMDRFETEIRGLEHIVL